METKHERVMEYVIGELVNNLNGEERLCIIGHYKPHNPNCMISSQVLRQVWDNDANFVVRFPHFSIEGSRSRYCMRLDLKRKDRHADSVCYTILFWDNGSVDYSVNFNTTLDI